MSLNQDNTLFFIIDIQEKLLNAVFNKESLHKSAKILAESAKVLNIPLIVTEQYPQGLGSTVVAVKDSAIVFEKFAFSALADSLLVEELKNANKNEIVIFGIETHICVYQTAIDLLDAGFNVTLVRDASGSRSEIEHDSALECLRQYGVNVKTTEMILFELLKSAKHPNFKEVQTLIK